MNNSYHFENKNLKERTTYFSWLITAIAGLIGFQFLLPIIKATKNSNEVLEWGITLIMIVILTSYFLLYRRLVSLTFNPSIQKLTLITTTLVKGSKSCCYDYADLSFKNIHEKGNLRKTGTSYIKIYNKKQPLITLERTSIGEDSFDQILSEFLRIN